MTEHTVHLQHSGHTPGTAAGPLPGAHAHAQPRGGGPADSPRRRLGWMLVLTTVFMGVEFAGGVLTGSLALIADAGHMLGDSLALLLSFLAMWLAGREATDRRTYGYKRAELLAAFVNALFLVLLAVWIVAEAAERLQTTHAVWSGPMLAVATAGLAVNLLGVGLLRGHAAGSLNVRAALWHVLGDLLGSLGAIAAAAVIYLTGWYAIDPLISMFIAVLIGISGGRILWDSANLLLDSVPKEIDTDELRRFLTGYPDVVEICDLHIWSVSSSEAMLSAHLVVAPEVDRDAFLHRLLRDLDDRFHLAHMTVQLESQPHASCPPQW